MVDFSRSISFQELGSVDAVNLLKTLRSHCSSGKDMHPDALKAIVLKLTYLSRDLGIKQSERDEAADMATSLANAAIKSYGRHSTFCADMLADLQAVLGRGVA